MLLHVQGFPGGMEPSAGVRGLTPLVRASNLPHVDPADEIVAIVDEHNCVVGSAARREMRARRLPHRAAYVLVFDSRGHVFVQKRTRTKDVFPGYYDPAAGGVVLAGETFLEAALRELEEEMGIRGVPLQDLFEFYYEDAQNRVRGAAYRCVYDGPVTLQEEEVESGAFMAVDDVLEQAAARPTTPDGLYVLRRYLETVGRGQP